VEGGAGETVFRGAFEDFAGATGATVSAFQRSAGAFSARMEDISAGENPDFGPRSRITARYLATSSKNPTTMSSPACGYA